VNSTRRPSSARSTVSGNCVAGLRLSAVGWGVARAPSSSKKVVTPPEKPWPEVSGAFLPRGWVAWRSGTPCRLASRLLKGLRREREKDGGTFTPKGYVLPRRHRGSLEKQVFARSRDMYRANPRCTWLNINNQSTASLGKSFHPSAGSNEGNETRYWKPARKKKSGARKAVRLRFCVRTLTLFRFFPTRAGINLNKELAGHYNTWQ